MAGAQRNKQGELGDGEIWKEEWDSIEKPASVFTPYKPRHVHYGVDHGQPLAEGTGLASVDPPPITYKLKMEKKFYLPEEGDPWLSKPQVEAIMYACASFEESFEFPLSFFRPNVPYTRGFYLGDGTGVGKSRQLAGMIYEAYLGGAKKHVWFTANQKLFPTIESEVSAFTKDIKFINLSELRKATNFNNLKNKPTLLMLTYHTFNDKKDYDLVLDWLKKGSFDGVLCLDEVHYCKSADNTRKRKSNRGMAALEFQMALPRAKIVYATATGASEVSHLAPFQRLAIWGKHKTYSCYEAFKSQITNFGVGGMEILSMELKMRGIFLSRHISLDGVEVESCEVPNDEIFNAVYKRLSDLILLMGVFLGKVEDEIMKQTEDKKKGTDLSHQFASQFYSATQRIFGSLIISAKVRTAFKKINDAVKNGDCCVVGLTHTGQTMFTKYLQEDYAKGLPFSITAYNLRSALVMLGVDIGCPKTYIDGQKEPINIRKWKESDEEFADHLFQNEYVYEYSGAPKSAKRFKSATKQTIAQYPKYSVGRFLSNPEIDDPSVISWSYNEVKSAVSPEGLARLYHEIYPFLPVNPLDELISRCESKGIRVADMTGRVAQHIWHDKGENSSLSWEAFQKPTIIEGKEDFMNGLADVAIISAATSTGLSLHSDLTAKNQKKRVHITLELGFSPDSFIQQLGRTHRSNQRVPPKYILMRSHIPGEERFIACVSKRVKQLGAITQGTVEASSLMTNHLTDDLCTYKGSEAINAALNALGEDDELKNKLDAMRVRLIGDDKKGKDSFFNMTIEEQVNKVLNRVLILDIQDQRRFFNTVYENYRAFSRQQKEHSPLMDGIPSNLDIDLRTLNFKIVEDLNLEVRGVTSNLLKFEVDRIASWDSVYDMALSDDGWHFYVRFKKGTEEAKEIILAKQQKDGTYKAIMPWCMYEKILPAKSLTGWAKENDYSTSQLTWVYSTETIRKSSPLKNGCDAKRRGAVCTHALANQHCQHSWGIKKFCIITRPTTSLLMLLRNHNITYVLRRVFFKTKDEKEQCVIGLYIGPENCESGRVDIIVMWAKELIEKGPAIENSDDSDDSDNNAEDEEDMAVENEEDDEGGETEEEDEEDMDAENGEEDEKEEGYGREEDEEVENEDSQQEEEDSNESDSEGSDFLSKVSEHNDEDIEEEEEVEDLQESDDEFEVNSSSSESVDEVDMNEGESMDENSSSE